MASFLTVIVSKKQTNREKYAFYYSVSHIHINRKKHDKTTKITFSDVPTYDYVEETSWLARCEHW